MHIMVKQSIERPLLEMAFSRQAADYASAVPPPNILPPLGFPAFIHFPVLLMCKSSNPAILFAFHAFRMCCPPAPLLGFRGMLSRFAVEVLG